MTAGTDTSLVPTHELISKVATRTVFFGHKSVGADIVDGLQELGEQTPGRRLNIIHFPAPGEIRFPAFVEADLGANGDTHSKNRGILAAVGQLHTSSAIVMFKYCYVDIDSQTDVRAVFSDYRQTIDVIQASYPAFVIVHITVPLTTSEGTAKAWVKSILRKPSARGANIKRNEFNRLLRQTYDPHLIFDLAEVESTRPDGSRTFFRDGSEVVYTLAPEYTSDGGHLNEVGRRVAALRLLQVLASR